MALSTGAFAPWRLTLAVLLILLVVTLPSVAGGLGTQGCAALGIVSFIALAFLFSSDPSKIDPRTVIAGFLLQLTMAFLVIRVEAVYDFFSLIGKYIQLFLSFADHGSSFVFGKLADPGHLEKSWGPGTGFIFAFKALPTVIFVSSVFTSLYYLGVLQIIVWVFSKLVLLIMGKKGISGAETLSATANVFMGQTEAPLIVKPYVKGMTQSELLALMIGGMSTISGGIMAVYIGMGADPVSILATSVMAAPAGLYLAKILLPETGEPQTRGKVEMNKEKVHANVVDAAAAGASEGMMLCINIVAMLIAFIAIVKMFDYGIAQCTPAGRATPYSLAGIFALVFEPVAVLMGVKFEDAGKVGTLLGEKLVLNEFVAYLDLTSNYYVPPVAPETKGTVKGMDEKSYKLATFALTGFANFASIGIQLGGIGAMAPERRGDLARLGMKALLGGFLATLINASIAGLLMR